MKPGYIALCITIICTHAHADSSKDPTQSPLWEIFKKSPYMINNCVELLTSGKPFSRETDWPKYCNTFENTELVQNKVTEILQARERHRLETERAQQQHRQRMLKEEQERQKRLSQGKIWVGATAEEARQAWGAPKDIYRTTTAAGTYEQWFYGGNNYIYIRNGYVEAIQN